MQIKRHRIGSGVPSRKIGTHRTGPADGHHQIETGKISNGLGLRARFQHDCPGAVSHKTTFK